MSESREALLAAAAEEFAQFGLHGARIRAIVARAGVNERMIYHHFGSKENLYGAVMDDQRRAVAQAWWPSLEKAQTMEPLEGMRYALRASLLHFSDGGVERAEIFGILSLIIWALLLTVTVKYVTFVLQADNKGG